ncbi:MAG: hypothetical protein KJ056_05470 [Acidimicrobiia bacterium]|nr:hypothetical protein [Acidimicrobiia bacterium]MCL4292462.1 hypothetical protein [Acidimicrobiia bacterium]
MDLEVERTARLAARARMTVGLGLMLAPGRTAPGWIGSAASGPGARFFARLTGARDLVIGLGGDISLAERRHPEGWFGMGALADAVDAAVSLLVPGLPLRARAAGLVAAGSAVAHLVLARRLAELADLRAADVVVPAPDRP